MVTQEPFRVAFIKESNELEQILFSWMDIGGNIKM